MELELTTKKLTNALLPFDHRINVKQNEARSNKGKVDMGVLQESVLGSLIFLIFMNDLLT